MTDEEVGLVEVRQTLSSQSPSWDRSPRGGAGGVMIDMSVPDIGNIGRPDRRRVYQYKEYLLHPTTFGDDEDFADGFHEGTLADAVAVARKLHECDYVLVAIEWAEMRWIPGHRDEDGYWIAGKWDHEIIDGEDFCCVLPAKEIVS